MATKGMRKLVDIADSDLIPMEKTLGSIPSVINARDNFVRVIGALEKYLERHKIRYKMHDHAYDGFRRYYVGISDLCCAQSVLPALKELAK